jgi:hypothetical protein
MSKFLAEWNRRYRFEHGLFCPHCGQEYVVEVCDGDGDLVSLYGSEGSIEVECKNPECGETFHVVEHVERTYTSRFSVGWSCEDEGKATFEHQKARHEEPKPFPGE